MTYPAASSGPGAPGIEIPAVAVTPGETAETTLTVRNDGDIVEAYSMEVVGDCAPWTTVEPARISLYPGTSETVTIRLAPPRSSAVRAGEVPLGVRVLPAEHPELVRVPETLVRVREFAELRTELAPRRRRGWLRGRYRLAVRNEGNAPIRLGFAPGQPGEELRFALNVPKPELEPGESMEAGLRVRTGKPVWFGNPVVWPFTVTVTTAPAGAAGDGTAPRTDAPVVAPDTPDTAPPLGAEPVQAPLDAEFVQIPVFPKWLLALLALIIALLLLWFTLVRPAVRSTAKDAADDAVQSRPTPGADAGGQDQPGGGGSTPGTQPGGGGNATPGAPGSQPGDGTKPGVPGAQPGAGGGVGGQSSATVDLLTNGASTNTGTYKVPEKTVFRITDLVVANFQGDEGVLTIDFGDRKITTIALETFRNQDYHWVTPIEIAANDTVTAEVTCAKPGTPATGQRAEQCHEVLNVSGVLVRTEQ
ncbi:hydrolytic protein [Streptomyces sp. NPDC048182]|uniref:COG1470 family protein n=1 Tax=Streptomyces sp. NPDC048182 TaxID=3365507 RepID=UPI003714432B